MTHSFLYKKTLEVLRKHQIHPKKNLSQHFLVDDAVFQKIVHSIRQEGKQYLEMGAGIGLLTEALAENGKTVIALEVDSVLIKSMQERFGCKNNILLLHQNLLKFHPEKFFKNNQWTAFGNLPYHISGLALRWLLEHRSFFTHFFLMLQKEVAERITAKPGSKAYGVLSLLFQYFTEPEILFLIPSHAFYPPPAVESAFLKFQVLPKENPENPLFIPLVKQAFRERRKTIFNNLKFWKLPSSAWEKCLAEADISKNKRAEELSLGTFQKLANLLEENLKNISKRET